MNYILALVLATVTDVFSLPHIYRRDAAQSTLIKYEPAVEECKTTDHDHPCQCSADKVITELRCEGTYCDDLYLGCSKMFDDLNDGTYVGVGSIIVANNITEHFAPVYCPENTAAVKLTCATDTCSKRVLECQAFEKHYNDGRIAKVALPLNTDPSCTWTGWIESGRSEPTVCPEGTLLIGAGKQMLCCPASLQAPMSPPTAAINSTSISEEVVLPPLQDPISLPINSTSVTEETDPNANNNSTSISEEAVPIALQDPSSLPINNTFNTEEPTSLPAADNYNPTVSEETEPAPLQDTSPLPGANNYNTTVSEEADNTTLPVPNNSSIAVKCTTDTDGKCKTKWKCFQGSTEITLVDIWWGHTAGDAAWACNSWNSQCGNAANGCTAVNVNSETIKDDDYADPPVDECEL